MPVEITHYKNLKQNDLHDIFQLRNQVFVLEQNCPFLDIDGKDPECFHVIMKKEGQLIGTARILPPGLLHKDVCSMGRFTIAAKFRGQKLSNELMGEIMQFAKKNYSGKIFKISAQKYLQNFYAVYGFEKTGDHYLEDAIPHLSMEYQLPA